MSEDRNSHVWLVGDAAGHVKVSTVGGVVTGFRGALGVVEAILNGGSSRELQALRRELDRHRLIRRVLHGFTQADYCRLLDMLTASTKRCLGLFPRDETTKLLLLSSMSCSSSRAFCSSVSEPFSLASSAIKCQALIFYRF